MPSWQYQQHPGSCQKCKFLGSASGLLTRSTEVGPIICFCKAPRWFWCTAVLRLSPYTFHRTLRNHWKCSCGWTLNDREKGAQHIVWLLYRSVKWVIANRCHPSYLPGSDSFTYINSFNPQISAMRWELVLFQFYRWGNFMKRLIGHAQVHAAIT